MRDETLTLDAAMSLLGRMRQHWLICSSFQETLAASVTSAGRGEHMSQGDVERR